MHAVRAAGFSAPRTSLAVPPPASEAAAHNHGHNQPSARQSILAKYRRRRQGRARNSSACARDVCATHGVGMNRCDGRQTNLQSGLEVLVAMYPATPKDAAYKHTASHHHCKKGTNRQRERSAQHRRVETNGQQGCIWLESLACNASFHTQKCCTQAAELASINARRARSNNTTRTACGPHSPLGRCVLCFSELHGEGGFFFFHPF